MSSLADVIERVDHLSLSNKNRVVCSITGRYTQLNHSSCTSSSSHLIILSSRHLIILSSIISHELGHEMMPQFEIVQKYLSSSKLRKAKDWYAYDYSKYLPYISEHKDNPKFMYCQLTRAEIPKIPEKVEVHVKSKRYQRRLAEAEEKMKKKKERAKNEASFWIPPGVVEEEDSTLSDEGVIDRGDEANGGSIEDIMDEYDDEEDDDEEDDDEEDDDDEDDDEEENEKYDIFKKFIFSIF